MTTSKATDGRLRIVTIVGARPQFIKAATVSRAIAAHNEARTGMVLEEKLVHTGQHYDDNMSRVFFEELEIPEPAYNLGIGSGSHGEQTGRMLERIEQVLLSEKPGLVLVYGDTNSTLAGALAAVKLHIPVAHVEAGLRSFVRTMPEEINRVLTDHLSDLLFCPTPTAVANLTHEGIEKGVHQVGDVMYDSTLFYARKVAPSEEDTLRRLGIARKSFYLATVHRAENTDRPERLAGIFEAFAEIATQNCPVIVPLHPRTVKCIGQYGLQVGDNVRIIDPASYLEMVVLEKNARKILTDSGGVQKEAYFLGVPCVTLRDETEWVETVEAGWNTLAGSDKQAIMRAVQAPSPQGANDGSLYGNGDAATRICKLLADAEPSSYRRKP
jgi:UDP-GlcNAc3NAcA epimerase